MNDNKGFTLTEVLLAAMIVGIIGVALAALTTAALRESGVARVRLMLRNQASLFLRQLRQDIRESSQAEILEGGQKLKLTQAPWTKLGPNHAVQTELLYTCQADATCTRGAETVLNYVQVANTADFKSPRFFSEDASGTDNVRAILHVQLVVGMNTNPAVKEMIDETIVLPQGFAIKKEN